MRVPLAAGDLLLICGTLQGHSAQATEAIVIFPQS